MEIIFLRYSLVLKHERTGSSIQQQRENAGDKADDTGYKSAIVE